MLTVIAAGPSSVAKTLANCLMAALLAVSTCAVQHQQRTATQSEAGVETTIGTQARRTRRRASAAHVTHDRPDDDDSSAIAVPKHCLSGELASVISCKLGRLNEICKGPAQVCVYKPVGILNFVANATPTRVSHTADSCHNLFIITRHFNAKLIGLDKNIIRLSRYNAQWPELLCSLRKRGSELCPIGAVGSEC